MFIIGALIFVVALALTSCATILRRNTRKEKPSPNRIISLSGKNVVISGNLFYFSSHEELKGRLESIGAKVSRRISHKTDILIVGESTTTGRLQDVKADKQGLLILLESEILPYL